MESEKTQYKYNYKYDKRLVAAVEYLITVQGIQSSQEIGRRLNVSRQTVTNIRDMLGLGREQMKKRMKEGNGRKKRERRKSQSFLDWLLGEEK